MPEQAKESGPEGASAFTKYWVDTLNYASNTGDLELLESISANTCSGCNKYINLYRETYAAGGYLRGGFWKIGDLAVKAWPNETLLTTTVQIAVGKSRQAENLPQTRDAAVSEVVSFGASRISGTWRMTQLGLGEIE